MYCRKCGAQLSDSSKFCMTCGSPVKPIPYNEQDQYSGSSEYSQSQYGDSSEYGSSEYGSGSEYGGSSEYSGSEYGASEYGQGQYAQGGYGQEQYGQTQRMPQDQYGSQDQYGRGSEYDQGGQHRSQGQGGQYRSQNQGQSRRSSEYGQGGQHRSQGQGGQYRPQGQQSSGGGSGKTIAIVGAIIGIVVLLGAALIVFTLFNKPKVNLNDYMKIEVNGAYPKAELKAVFDKEKFDDDWRGKLKFKDDSTDVAQIYGKDGAVDALYDSIMISQYFVNETPIKNGDQVTYCFGLKEDELENRFSNKIEFEDITFTVNGLSEYSSVDAFKDIEIQFTGDGSDITATVINNSNQSPMAYWDYVPDRTTGLKEGDTITVTIEPDNPTAYDECASTYGFVPETMTKQYTVGNVSFSSGDTDSTTEATTEVTTEAPKSADGQVFSDSSSRLLTEAEVKALSKDEVQTAINEIYARHGYRFETDSIRKHFEQYDWYNPTVSPDDFSESSFSSTEKANIDLLRAYR